MPSDARFSGCEMAQKLTLFGSGRATTFLIHFLLFFGIPEALTVRVADVPKSPQQLLQKQRREHIGPKAIPCVIHQTWKSHSLNPSQQASVISWKSNNPKCQHKLWNDTEIAELCQKKSPDLMWPIWDALSPIERADVFRYLVLWDQGGYYADLDVPCEESIDAYDIPSDVNMIVGYENGRRLTDSERQFVKFVRNEQFEQWFLASAPGNPILLRCLEIVKEKFLWKIQPVLDLTGPGTFSDAVHEFLAKTAADANASDVGKEVKDRLASSVHFSQNLSFPSERAYSLGDWKLWLVAAGRMSRKGYAATADLPGHMFVDHLMSGTWKR